MGALKVNENLSGLRIIVTSASSGIGLRIAEYLASKGARVVACSRSFHLQKHHPNIYFTRCDLRYKSDVINLFNESLKVLGGVDSIVYVPPPPSSEPLEPLEYDFEDVVESCILNLATPLILLRMLAKHVRSQGSKGSMVLLASVTIAEPMSPFLVSDMCQAGITRLVKIISRNLSRYGIKISALLIGSFETAGAMVRVSRIAEMRGLSGDAWRKLVVSRIPCQHAQGWDELFKIIELMVDPRLLYLNGSIIVLDCSMTRAVII